MASRARGVPRLGSRGEGWVALQFLLLGALAATSLVGIDWPRRAAAFLEPAGFAVLGAGLAVFVLSAATLGRSLTPLPRPAAAAILRRGGIYRRVRHPLYSGLLLAALGWSLAEAPLGLLASALLAIVLAFKSRAEEAWLLERYPEYAAYRAATPARFVPRLR